MSSTVILFDGATVTQLDGVDRRSSRLAPSQLLWVDLDDPSDDELDQARFRLLVGWAAAAGGLGFAVPADLS